MRDGQAPGVRDFGQVTFHVEGPLGIITLNPPEVLNAQGYELLGRSTRRSTWRRLTRLSARSSSVARAACSRPATT